MNEGSAPVLFREITCVSGKIGLATLNYPKALNSLTLEMVQLLSRQLQKWADDPAVRMVFLHSESERAFCAGGDVKTVVLKRMASATDSYPRDFFKWEYKTDYMIHTFPKPLVCWGDAIVMGGGIGLFNGASHRVVTERTTLAMPEITIGFFPDVGGGYFLNQLPDGLGLFLGWTAARLTAGDAMFIKMADHFVASGKKAEVLESLGRVNFTGKAEQDRELVSKVLRSASAPAPESRLASFLPEIQAALGGKSPQAAHEAMLAWTSEDTWMQACLESYKKGSPYTAHVIYEQLKRERGLSKRDVFLTEWNLASHLCDSHDFPEGVRSLLIDKDQKPQWQYKRFEDVPHAEVTKCFAPTARTAEIAAFFDQPLAE